MGEEENLPFPWPLRCRESAVNSNTVFPIGFDIAEMSLISSRLTPRSHPYESPSVHTIQTNSMEKVLTRFSPVLLDFKTSLIFAIETASSE